MANNLLGKCNTVHCGRCGLCCELCIGVWAKLIFTSTCLPGSVKENATETEMVARLETDSPIITCRVTGTVSKSEPASFFQDREEKRSRGRRGLSGIGGFLLWSPPCFHETHEIWRAQFGNPPADLTQTHGGFLFETGPSLWLQEFRRDPSAIQVMTAASGGTIAAAVAAGIVDVTAVDASEPASLESLWQASSDSSAKKQSFSC